MDGRGSCISHCTLTIPELPGLAAGIDDVAVVSQAIQQCRGHLGVAEYPRPLGKASVCADDHIVAFVELGEQVEQSRPPA